MSIRRPSISLPLARLQAAGESFVLKEPPYLRTEENVDSFIAALLHPVQFNFYLTSRLIALA